MSTSYAAFRVDPSINFDNFNSGSQRPPRSPTVSNFSRPISVRPAPSPNTSHLSLVWSDSSRRSSNVSLKGPLTPNQDVPIHAPITRPIFASLEADHQFDTPSFMLDSQKSPKLDLSFAVESVMRTYMPQSTSQSTPQPPVEPAARSNEERPLTAIGLDPAPVLTPANATKMCPVHGARPSTTALSPTQPSLTPPTNNHVENSRKSISGPVSGMQRPETAKALPSLPFLEQDPFQSSLGDEHNRARPRSAGVGASHAGPANGDFILDGAQPGKKQSAPSIKSTRSMRSVRNGLSRVRRMLARAKVVL